MTGDRATGDVRSSTSPHRQHAMRPRLGGGGIVWMVAHCGQAMT
ncbi:MAG: hypothetical protein WBQ75_09195 [Acetobacteraceae bacterium]